MQTCCNEQKDRSISVCPTNGSKCRNVSRITVESLVRPEANRYLTNGTYYFCAAEECNTVYFSSQGILITKDQLEVRVGAKERDDPIPLCYCFNFDRKDIWDDIRLKDTTEIPALITERVRVRECRCEFANPRGSCCLGEVYRAVKQAHVLKKDGVL
jgi:hypothetical protein